MTHKEDPKKCRGFAFLEFDNFDRMKTCLAKFHHSTFYAEGDKPEEGGEEKGGDDGKGGRKVNVELTYASMLIPIHAPIALRYTEAKDISI